MNKQGKLHVIGNLLGLFIICSILSFVLIEQLIFHDLPCPLCSLQRISFAAIGISMLMNLRLGFRPAHYGFMILATLVGLGVSIRQIVLHLAANDPGYGIQISGYGLYHWATIGFVIIMILIAVALIFDGGFNRNYRIQNKWSNILIGLFLFLILAHGISTFILCGPFTCPDDPTEYYFKHST